MRWFWIDHFTEFVSGSHAAAVKNVSLVEDHIDEYLPGHPTMAGSLTIEGLAQTGGLLLGQMSDFRARVVLAKISRAVFHQYASPGDRLIYRATIESNQPGGAIVKGTSHCGDKLQAEIDLFFAELDDARFENVELFEPGDFLRMLRLLKLFEVGKFEDGSPIQIPVHMLDAEQELIKAGLRRRQSTV